LKFLQRHTRLRKIRNKKIQEAFNAIKIGDYQEANRIVEEQKIVNDYFELSTKDAKYYLFATVLALVLLGIGLFSSIRIPLCSVRVEVEVSEVGLKPGSEIYLANTIPLNNLFLFQVDSIETEDTIVGRTDNYNPMKVQFSGEDLNLNDLKISSGSIVQVSKVNNLIALYLPSGGLSGSAILRNGSFLFNQYEWPIQVQQDYPNYSAYFEWFPEDRFIPGRIDMMMPDSFLEEKLFIGSEIDSISFLEQIENFDENFIQLRPSINAGTLNILNTREVISFLKGENLLMDIETVDQFFLSVNGSYIDLVFEGQVSSLKVGPKGKENKLMPTFLESYYSSKYLSIIWAVLIVVWGGALTIYRIMFKRNR